ncbi:bacillithiol biosynthesis deacetylase BshB2 [Paenibacillus sp. PL2-23]|uniref:bacillithiol biosynthesis deacetylase BshB2 n=1 Tax=Paenibacillus sp. PL2-23 TaxID=2100729 RepID=UPI0030F8EA7E
MGTHILVILPHPDDEAFGLSGTLAKEISSGALVTYACLTLGEMGRNMGIPPFANRESLKHIRKLELEASCEAIGIQDLRLLGFHDKTIEFEDPQLLDEKIGELLAELRPHRVYTFYPGYSVHPDHDACGAAVVRSVSKLPEKDRPPVYCIAFSRNHEEAIGQAEVLVDVRDYMTQKLASIRAHRTQFQAPELVGSKELTAKELEDRFGVEQFWIYRFQ